MQKKSFLVFLGLLFVLSACTRPTKTYTPTLLPSGTSPSSTQAALVQQTQTPIAEGSTATPTTTAEVNDQAGLLPTATNEPQAQATEFTEFTVHSTVEGLLLRMGPGTMYDAWRMLGSEDELTVKGTIAGNEWTAVTNAEGIEGWVFNQLLDSPTDLTKLPVLTFDAQVVKGHVQDVAGTPIRGIAFEISNGETTIVVVSDKAGDFYWYSPTETTGIWTITQTGLSCDSNIWVSGGCEQMLPGLVGNTEPATIDIDLSLSSDAGTFIFR